MDTIKRRGGIGLHLTRDHGLCVLFVSLLVLAGGVYLILSFGPTLWNAYSSRSWPTTTGRVVQSLDGQENFRPRGASLRERGRRIPGSVTYTYEVGGVRHTGHRLCFSTEGGAPATVTEEYGKGRDVTVYYDPRDPSMSVLIPGGHDKTLWICFWIGLSLAVFSLDAVLFRVRRLFDEVLVCFRTCKAVEPAGLIVEGPDSVPDDSCMRLVIPKTEPVYGFYIRVFVIAWLFALVAWIPLAERVAFWWTAVVSGCVLALFTVMRARGSPRMSIWIDPREVIVADIIGKETDRSTGWMSGQASIPIDRIVSVIVLEHYLSVRYIDPRSKQQRVYTQAASGFPKGTLPWLAVLLSCLQSQRKDSTSSTTGGPGRSLAAVQEQCRMTGDGRPRPDSGR